MSDAAAADEFVHTIVRDWRDADLTDRDRILCDFATLVTRDQSRLRESHLDDLRAQGFTDREIHDAAQVIAYFNYISRIADALGVEEETFIHRWGTVSDGAGR